MKLRLVTAGTGATWVNLGLRTFFKQPIALSSVFFLGMLVMMVISAVPMVGSIVATALAPAVTVAMMVATAQVTQGQRPMPWVLLSAFRSSAGQTRSMVILGALFSAAISGVFALSAWVDGGQLLGVMQGTVKFTPELAKESAFRNAMWLMLGLSMAVSVLIWHAPGLIHWHKVTPIKALFFSAVACVRNGGAFLIYGVVAMGLMIGSSMAISVVGGILLALGLPSMVVMSFLMVLTVMVVVMVTASQVFSFRDSFEAPGTANDLSPETPEPPATSDEPH